MTALAPSAGWDAAQTLLVPNGLRIIATIVIALVVRPIVVRIIRRGVRSMAARSEQTAQNEHRARARRHAAARNAEQHDAESADESASGPEGEPESDGEPSGEPSRSRIARAKLWSEASDFAAGAAGLRTARQQQRLATLGSLLTSVVTLIIGLIAGLTVMAIVGIPLAPLLASAGVTGVALGIGAQSLVRDFLSGIFMIIEDQYGVGDEIDTGEATGTVVQVSLRVTTLRDDAGVTWYIRNGEIIRVGNMSQHRARAIIDVPVAYTEDPDKVIDVLTLVCGEMADDERWQGDLLGVPRVAGVQSLSGQTMTMRIFAETAPGEKHAVARELRQRIKTAFDAAGIEAPPPPFGGISGAGTGALGSGVSGAPPSSNAGGAP